MTPSRWIFPAASEYPCGSVNGTSVRIAAPVLLRALDLFAVERRLEVEVRAVLDPDRVDRQPRDDGLREVPRGHGRVGRGEQRQRAVLHVAVQALVGDGLDPRVEPEIGRRAG